MDALTDVLKTLRLNTQTYFCSDFHSPWGIVMDESSEGMFHVVVEGSCFLNIKHSQSTIPLKKGDIVAFPSGGAHWISDHEDSPKVPSSFVLNKILSGESPFKEKAEPLNKAPKNTLMCGSFSYDTKMKHPFIRDLPCFIHIKAEQNNEQKWMNELVATLSRESRSPSPGSSLVLDRLTEVLFIQIIRHFLASQPNKHNYLAALNDQQIGTTLNLIHAETSAHWTIKKLGEEVAMSRSAFTDKFSKLVGQAPKTYLLNWRMQKAKTRLESTDDSMYQIAEDAGYSSEAAFSKAFKTFFTETPGFVRRASKY
ncbi:AraC family transcriptional regulator [Marinomonas sp. PE14-40]|uniref:AraC family transcriptional regulator n=1 Tax=Marinomonas sp. PE14-40 TaxID=3060621 RepID=UPI003F67B6FF